MSEDVVEKAVAAIRACHQPMLLQRLTFKVEDGKLVVGGTLATYYLRQLAESTILKLKIACKFEITVDRVS